MSTITAIIPTYQRPKDLARCLEALKQQTRPADKLLVIIRDTDIETWKFLETFDQNPLPLHTLTVSVPGVIAAMNVGLDAAQGDIIAFTDDDAVPHPDWLERIETHFLLDERLGGVGGRDLVYHGTKLEDGAREVVGQVQWFGRIIGNHHLGIGAPREVDVLKGVNMSYRRTAISGMRFDNRLRGTGAQVHFEIAFSFALKRNGWKLIYDPLIAVDHYPGQRFDEDERRKFNEIAWSNRVHNETLILLEYLPPWRRIVFLVWAVLIGTKNTLGLFQWFRFLPREPGLAGQKLLISLQGRWQGWQTWKQSKKIKTANTSILNSHKPI